MDKDSNIGLFFFFFFKLDAFPHRFFFFIRHGRFHAAFPFLFAWTIGLLTSGLLDLDHDLSAGPRYYRRPLLDGRYAFGHAICWTYMDDYPFIRVFWRTFLVLEIQFHLLFFVVLDAARISPGIPERLPFIAADPGYATFVLDVPFVGLLVFLPVFL
ncbi:hypothetical protein BJ138DRAFT_794500 [Hygrophoropsis aurantiaca]|uniref:Uncharacterized protein n=1 Tax=Hygrophoropsis aurantiaca TaxID=72124 RepID=A0ACB8AGP8_9AGAM|nr:hypothetical protein BJ138DRAFT_794500 [Hygrophoropsis aurantiaca]